MSVIKQIRRMQRYGQDHGLHLKELAVNSDTMDMLLQELRPTRDRDRPTHSVTLYLNTIHPVRVHSLSTVTRGGTMRDIEVMKRLGLDLNPVKTKVDAIERAVRLRGEVGDANVLHSVMTQRQFGRTTKILVDAVAAVSNWERVRVVGHSDRWSRELQRRLHEMCKRCGLDVVLVDGVVELSDDYGGSIKTVYDHEITP